MEVSNIKNKLVSSLCAPFKNCNLTATNCLNRVIIDIWLDIELMFMNRDHVPFISLFQSSSSIFWSTLDTSLDHFRLISDISKFHSHFFHSWKLHYKWGDICALICAYSLPRESTKCFHTIARSCLFTCHFHHNFVPWLHRLFLQLLHVRTVTPPGAYQKNLFQILAITRTGNFLSPGGN